MRDTLSRRKVLLDANTTVSNGPWYFVGDFDAITIHVFGIVAGDTVQVWGSNDDGFKTGITNEDQIGATISADDMVGIDPVGFRWIRVKRTAIAGGGTVSAVMNAN